MRVDILGGFIGEGLVCGGARQVQDKTRPDQIRSGQVRGGWRREEGGGGRSRGKKKRKAKKDKNFQSIHPSIHEFSGLVTASSFSSGRPFAVLLVHRRTEQLQFSPDPSQSRRSKWRVAPEGKKGKNAMGMWGIERAAGACPVGPCRLAFWSSSRRAGYRG